MQKQLQKIVTKTIAAFLNSAGGTLLIGVDNAGAVLGIEPDFTYLRQDKQDSDGWLLSLKDATINVLGLEVWNGVHASLVRHGQQTVAVVICPARATETWYHEDGAERFYMRASNATEELKGSKMLRYMREHWPA